MTNLLLLLGAAALMPFANGRWSVALAAWIAPALLIRFLRGQPPGRGAVAGIAWYGAAGGANCMWPRAAISVRVQPIGGPWPRNGNEVIAWAQEELEGFSR